MPQIEIAATGLIYRNPKPFLRSIHAYFPSLVLLPNGELLCAFGIGSAFESIDFHTELARSRDGGNTWIHEGILYQTPPEPLASSNVRISQMPNGDLIAIGARWDRSRADMGLVNPETGGFVPTELIWLHSHDNGHTWSEPHSIAPPLVGPSFELCHAILPMQDGRWLWPTATWKGWDGANPNGMKAVAFVSHDEGRTWPAFVNVMDGIAEGIVYWEVKLIPLGDKRLLALCWTHNTHTDQDLPIHYALSKDDGRNFSAPRSTGLIGQTATPLWLGDGRILVVYRRTDAPGLWATQCHLSDDLWHIEAQTPLWGMTKSATRSGQQAMVVEMSNLKFGLPCVIRLPNDEVFVAFWCVEDCVGNIRWIRLKAA